MNNYQKIDNSDSQQKIINMELFKNSNSINDYQKYLYYLISDDEYCDLLIEELQIQKYWNYFEEYDDQKIQLLQNSYKLLQKKMEYISGQNLMEILIFVDGLISILMLVLKHQKFILLNQISFEFDSSTKFLERIVKQCENNIQSLNDNQEQLEEINFMNKQYLGQIRRMFIQLTDKLFIFNFIKLSFLDSSSQMQIENDTDHQIIAKNCVFQQLFSICIQQGYVSRLSSIIQIKFENKKLTQIWEQVTYTNMDKFKLSLQSFDINKTNIQNIYFYDSQFIDASFFFELMVENYESLGIAPIEIKTIFMNTIKISSLPLNNQILQGIQKYVSNSQLLQINKDEIKILLDIDRKTDHFDQILIIYYLAYKQKQGSKLEIIYDIPIQFHFQNFKKKVSKQNQLEMQIINEIKSALIDLIPVIFIPTLNFKYQVQINNQINNQHFNSCYLKKVYQSENSKLFCQVAKNLLSIDLIVGAKCIIETFVKLSINLGQFQNKNLIDPMHVLLIKKKFIQDLCIQEVILDSLSVLLKNWEHHILQSQEESKDYYLYCLKSSIIHYLIQNLSEEQKLMSHEKSLCEFIHSMCIEDLNLIKIIIFQGYNPNLIQKTVQNIEWMHASLYFAEEIILKNESTYLIFGWQFIAHIILKYPTQRSYEISEFFIQYIIDNLKNLYKGIYFQQL